MSRTNERLLQQSFQTVAGRVASALLAQTVSRQAEGAPEADVLIRATQAEIAHLAGTSRESASRFLATLERAGVVTLGRGKVTVHDPATTPELHPLRRVRAWWSASCAGAASTTSACWRRWREVPRERFVPEDLRRRAYRDGALRIGEGQTISQPWIVACMAQLLELAGTRRCSRWAPGSGYGAAVLSRLCAEVVTIERYESLAAEGRARRCRARLRQRRGAASATAPRRPRPRALRRHLGHRDRARRAARPRCSTSSRRAPRWSARSTAAAAST